MWIYENFIKGFCAYVVKIMRCASTLRHFLRFDEINSNAFQTCVYNYEREYHVKKKTFVNLVKTES